MNHHPASALFRMMDPLEYEAHKASISKVGLLHPIVLLKGEILDGRNRFKACSELGINPSFENFHENGVTASDYVVSVNLDRRHLTASEKACAGAELREIQELERCSIAKERGISPSNKTIDLVKSKGFRSASHMAGKAVGVGETMVCLAYKLKKKNKKYFNKVKAGEITLQKALRRCAIDSQFSRQTANRIKDTEVKSALENSIPYQIKGLPSVYSSDFDIWLFDSMMQKNGYNLSLTRCGENFDAIYTKESIVTDGFCPSYKAAIISAGRAILEGKN